MLNEERVKLMVQLASYEQKEGKEDFKVSSYYKKDYVSFHRLGDNDLDDNRICDGCRTDWNCIYGSGFRRTDVGKSNYFSSSDFDNLCDCVSRILDSERAVLSEKA
mgnify:CR=1 FL=1